MTNDLDALVERVKELRAQLKASGPEERIKKIKLSCDLERAYLMMIKNSTEIKSD